MHPHDKHQPYELALDKRDDARRSSSLRMRLLVCLLAVVGLSTLFRLPRYCHHAVPQNALTIEERVKDILTSTPLIDGHNDLPILIRALHGNHIYNETFRDPFESGKLAGHVDLVRLREGRIGGSFWSVFWTCQSNMLDFSVSYPARGNSEDRCVRCRSRDSS
jgi:membrane dipeptidase